jgi:hypothetical protein
VPGRNESFFHGTTNDIVGGVVRPGQEVGHSNFGETGSWAGQPSKAHAFATTSEDVAWHFAHDVNDYQTEDYYTGRKADMPDRARVYTVAPHPEMKRGHYHDQFQEYVAPHYNVTGRIDIKPGHQGTFPTINWRQFQRYATEGDVNHPSPEQVAHGMNYEPYQHAEAEELNRIDAEDVPHQRVMSTEGQMDLFSGHTAAEHAWGRAGGRSLKYYHLARLAGQPMRWAGEL